MSVNVWRNSRDSRENPRGQQTYKAYSEKTVAESDNAGAEPEKPNTQHKKLYRSKIRARSLQSENCEGIGRKMCKRQKQTAQCENATSFEKLGHFGYLVPLSRPKAQLQPDQKNKLVLLVILVIWSFGRTGGFRGPWLLQHVSPLRLSLTWTAGLPIGLVQRCAEDWAPCVS